MRLHSQTCDESVTSFLAAPVDGQPWRELLAFDEFYKAVVAQEAEVPHKVKPGRTHFHFGQVDDLFEIPPPITPVKGGDRNERPGA